MAQPTLRLFNYFRSSASYRVRIALHWKGLPFEYVPVHLVKGGGEQHSAKYRALNPMGHVPALEHGGFVVAESMAIIEYLDRIFPERPLFPSDAPTRARVIQICETVNSGIQPYQNLKLLQRFETHDGWDQQKREDFVRYWVGNGLENLEKILAGSAGTHAVGGEITAADAFIIPQLFSVRRFKIDISKFPILSRIESSATALEAFKKAHPEAQPDFER